MKKTVVSEQEMLITLENSQLINEVLITEMK